MKLKILALSAGILAGEMTIGRTVRLPLRWLAALLLATSLASAHEGFVTRLEDEPIGGYTVTVLNDIHGGSGTVLLFLEVAGAAAPEGTEVSVRLRPLGGEPFGLEAAEYRGAVSYLERQRAMFFAFPTLFEQADSYLMEVLVTGAGGEIAFEVEVTPAPLAEL